jgi:hypothetical protein
LADHERISVMRAQVALELGDYPAVRRWLEREFCTIREGEGTPSVLWFASYVQEAEQRAGRKLTPAETQQVVQQHPLPHALDFRMR